MKNYQSSAMRQNAVLLNAGKLSKKFAMFGLAVAITTVSMLSSCKKDSDEVAAPSLKATSDLAITLPGVGDSASLNNVTTGYVKRISSSVYKVFNYYVAQSVYNPANPHQANGLYYFDFSLNDNKLGATTITPPVSAWDVSFSGTGNADIKVNAGSSVSIKYLNENFATASARSATSAWGAGTAVSTSATFGHNRTIMTTPLAAADYLAGTPIVGWWNYYFGNHQVIATTDLTILVQDTVGDIYAVHMISVYNNNTPTGTPFPSNFSYLTFEYKKLS